MKTMKTKLDSDDKCIRIVPVQYLMGNKTKRCRSVTEKIQNERIRRKRINRCINELRDFVNNPNNKNLSKSSVRLENADVLEIVLRQLQTSQCNRNVQDSYRCGIEYCTVETLNFLQTTNNIGAVMLRDYLQNSSNCTTEISKGVLSERNFKTNSTNITENISTQPVLTIPNQKQLILQKIRSKILSKQRGQTELISPNSGSATVYPIKCGLNSMWRPW